MKDWEHAASEPEPEVYMPRIYVLLGLVTSGLFSEHRVPHTSVALSTISPKVGK